LLTWLSTEHPQQVHLTWRIIKRSRKLVKVGVSDVVSLSRRRPLNSRVNTL
jgi:hypothetical protein